MRKLRLFYQNNKEKIWKVLGIIVLVIVIIHLIDYNISKEKEQNNQNNIDNTTSNETSYNPSTAIIAGSNISKKSAEKNMEIIEQFINYCNNSQIEEAYNCLSDDCKQELFPAIEDFYNKYCKKIFEEKKSYETELWSTAGIETYRVKIISDIITTGKIDKQYIEDYYSIVDNENGEKKLNIKNFIYKVELNKVNTVKNIEFNVISKKIYKEYEEFEIEVKNNSDNKVVIDTKENTETVYLKDTNNVKYNWYGHEIPDNKLEIEKGNSVKLNIKFNKILNPDRKDNTINFQDVHIEGQEEVIKVEIKI